MAVQKTQAEVELEISKIHKGEYRLISEYSNTKSPIMLKHNCGHIYSVGRCKTFTHEDGGKCPKCREKTTVAPRSSKKITFSSFKEKFFDNYVGYSFISESDDFYYDSRSFKIKHNICGSELLIRPKDWCRAVKLSCAVCANKSRKEHIQKNCIKDDYLENLTKDTDYIFVEEYKKDNKLKHTLLHKTCNRTYDVRPNDFQQGYRCPHCSQEKTESYASADITNFLIERNIPFEKEKKLEGCVFKNSLRFDFAIKHPFLDKILLVEYDGEQHFKTSGMFNKEKVKLTQERDDVKNKFCEDNKDKYTLRRIRYDENHIERINEFLIEFLV